MKVSFLPFFSMQDKRTGKFLYHKEGACTQFAFFADRVQSELGWATRVLLPDPRLCVDYHAISLRFPQSDVTVGYVPLDNRVQRMHWDTKLLLEATDGADVAVCQHEFLAIPLRVLRPKLRIVQWCIVDPVPRPLFDAAWDAADLVVHKYPAGVGSVWPMAYDEAKYPQLPVGAGERTIDVLFLPRCSADNCTHHLEAVEAGVKYFTDPTHYLKTHPEGEGLEYVDRYSTALRSAKVVVSLREDAYGGVAIREAVRCGCVPVLLCTEAHERLAGSDWPLFVDRPEPTLIAETVCRALQANVGCVEMQRRVAQESYQASWETVKRDLEALCL